MNNTDKIIEIVNIKLLDRGFTRKRLLNNRGLISATVEDTIEQINSLYQQGVIQPKDIEELLEDKRESDEMGYTGMYIVSVKDIIDLFLSPKSESEQGKEYKDK